MDSDTKATIVAISFVISWSDRLVPPLIFLIGTVGNLLITVVYCRFSVWRIVDIMIVGLAICDEFVVTSQGLMWLLESSKLTPRSAWNSASCQGLDFMIRIGIATASWLIVLISLDRMVALRYALSDKIILKKRHFAIMFGIVTALNLILYGHMPKTFALKKMVSGFYKCDINVRHGSLYGQLFYWFDSVYASLLPATLIIIFNAFILHSLRSHDKELNNLQMSNQEQQAKRLRSRIHRQLTTMLLAISVCFLVTTLPYRVMKPISKVIPRSPVVNKAVGLTLNSTKKLCLANSAVNFFLYLGGSKFRRQLLAILTRRDPGEIASKDISKTSTTRAMAMARVTR